MTQATIYSTICVAGWTATVRPSSSYTTGLKEQQLATGYAWHGDTYTGDYEEDHLVPFELGGSPSSPKNLWPEPYDYADGDGAVSKDEVENRLHELVCSGAVGLRIAQRAIATDWWQAARRHASAPVARSSPTHTGAPARARSSRIGQLRHRRPPGTPAPPRPPAVVFAAASSVRRPATGRPATTPPATPTPAPEARRTHIGSEGWSSWCRPGGASAAGCDPARSAGDWAILDAQRAPRSEDDHQPCPWMGK